MIELIQKLPDGLVGIALAGGLWLGFNHAVLAPRAMEHMLQAEVLPACEQALAAEEGRAAALMAPVQGLLQAPLMGDLLRGLPLDMRLGAAQRRAICACGAELSSRAARFDYAVHTASFRLLEPESVAGLRGDAMALVRSEACGLLPWIRLGD